MKKIFYVAAIGGMLMTACQSNTSGEAQKTEPVDTVQEQEASQAGQQPLEDEQLVLDVERTNIMWVGSKPTEDHSGNLNARGGVMGRNKGEFVHGAIVLDMTSITVTDIEDPEKNAKLVGHLKNEDFFATDKYPTADLQLVNMEQVNETTVRFNAELRIKENRAPITFELTENSYADSVVYDGEFIFDRTTYDIKYKSKSFFSDLGDKFINDEVRVNLHAVFDRVKQQ